MREGVLLGFDGTKAKENKSKKVRDRVTDCKARGRRLAGGGEWREK